LRTAIAVIVFVGAAVTHTAKPAFAADAPLTLVRGDVGVTTQEGGSLPTGTIYGIFNDPDQCSGTGDFTLTADLGDGTPTNPDVESGNMQAVLEPGTCNWDLQLAPGWSNIYTEENTYHIVWTVKDAGGNILSIASTATVADAPLSSSPAAPLSSTEGSALSGQLGSFSDANNITLFGNPDCENEGPWPPAPATSEPDVTHYVATVNWGDGSQSVGAVTPETGCTFAVNGSHTYSEEGTYNAHVTVQDEGGSTTAWDVSVNVTDASVSFHDNPLLPTVVEGQPTGDLAWMVFHDSDPNCTSGDYSAVLNWGDGSGIPQSEIRVRNGSSPGDCNFSVVGNHTYAEAGTYLLHVDFYDAGTVASGGVTITVQDAPLGAVQAGSALLSTNDATSTEVLGTFRDGSCNEPVANYAVNAVSFGDGSVDIAQVSLAPSTDGNPCDIDVIGHHVYTSPGTYSTSVTIQDEDGESVTVAGNSNVGVSDAPLTLVRGSIGETIPEGGSLASSTIYGVFHDPDQCNGGLGDFTLTADLGDGTPTQPDIATSFIHAVPDAGGNCNWDVELDPNWFNIYIEEGTYHVVWTVKDAGGNLLSIPSTIEVPDAPLTSSGAVLPTIYEGNQFSGQLGTFADGNSNGFFPTDCEQEGNWPPGLTNPAEPDATHYHGSVTWGDGAVTDATITHVPGGCTFNVSAAHTYNEEGTYTIHVELQDEGGSVTFFDSTITVADAPLTSTSPQTAINSTQHLTLTNELVGKFTDTDPFGAVADYSAMIAWGDGVQAPGIVERDPAGGNLFDVYGAHTYASSFSNSTGATITVFDTAGSKTQWTDPVTVAPYDSPLTLARGDTSTNIIEGGGLLQNFVYGIFDDPDECTTLPNAQGDYTNITADLGDGTPGTPDIVGGPNGVENGYQILRVVHDPNAGNSCLWDVELGAGWSNWYSETGVYHIVFTVQDAAGNTVSIPSVATVVDAPLSSSGTALTPVSEGVQSTMNLGSFNDGNGRNVFGWDCENEGPAPYGPPNSELDSYHYQATVEWGDGSSSTATLTQNFSGPFGSPCNFLIGGTHTYAEEGNYSVHVTVHDEDGGGTNFTDSLTVSDAGLAQVAAPDVKATEGQPTGLLKLATFTDADPACSTDDYAASVHWGDGGSSPGTIAPAGGCSFDVYGGHTYNEEGTLTASVNVLDHGASLAIPLAVDIADAPLSLQTPTAGSSISCTLLTPCGATVASFADSNPACMSEGSPAEPPASHYSASINWGDGSPQVVGTVTQRPGQCVFDVTGPPHTFTSPTTGGPPFAITVTINDEGGSTANGSVVQANVSVPPTKDSSKLDKANAAVTSANFTINEKLTYNSSKGTFDASLSLSDPTQNLSIPSCSTSPSSSCRLTILGYQSAYTSSTAKSATLFAKYVYTSGGTSITRYARIDLGDVDPLVADTIKVTMSSTADPTVSATSPVPPAPNTFTGAVVIQ
jgi:hypothetical protein